MKLTRNCLGRWTGKQLERQWMRMQSGRGGVGCGYLSQRKAVTGRRRGHATGRVQVTRSAGGPRGLMIKH